jgi:hypothetical protein
MTPPPTSRDLNYHSAARLAAQIENMHADSDPVPVSRAKTVSPGMLLLAVVAGCIATATLGNWFHSKTVAFNDIFVKFFMVLIPLLALAGLYCFVRFIGFWRANSAAEAEAMAEAEAEVLAREARFAKGRIRGDRRLCIRPLNQAKRAAKRRRADRLRTA